MKFHDDDKDEGYRSYSIIEDCQIDYIFFNEFFYGLGKDRGIMRLDLGYFFISKFGDNWDSFQEETHII